MNFTFSMARIPLLSACETMPNSGLFLSSMLASTEVKKVARGSRRFTRVRSDGSEGKRR